MTKRTSSKAARLMILYHLRQDGIIADLTLQEIGDALGFNRSTIMRDLRELDSVEQEYRHIMATQPWLKREFSTAEVAEDLGVSSDTIRRMIQDDMIVAFKRGEHWRIALAELNRWRDVVRAQKSPG